MAANDDSWKKFLHPETLKGNLIAISLFITAYETFKNQVITKPETFYCNGCDKGGLIIDETYSREVLSLSKSKLYASLLWLKKIGAIDQNDIDIFDSIKKHRNELVHEPMEFIANADRNFDVSRFRELVALFSKIEKWWIINFELGIAPDILPADANPEEVIPGPIAGLHIMLEIALGNEPKEGWYYNIFNANKT